MSVIATPGQNDIISRLQRIQNNAARLITQSKIRDHVTPILSSLHWLPVKYRSQFKILTIVYNSLHGLAPVYLQELLTEYKPSRTLRSQSKALLQVPVCRTSKFGKRTFSAAAANLWNTLPLELREVDKLSNFNKNSSLSPCLC